MKNILYCVLCMIAVGGSTAPTKAATKVFLFAGQSNMYGYAVSSELVGALAKYHEPQSRVWRWDNSGNQWLVNSNFPGNTWFGPAVSFGYQMQATYPDDNIYLIKLAYSGTSLFEEWKPGKNPGRCYAEFKSTVQKAIQNLIDANLDPHIAGMLWMQGEHDAANAPFAPHYQENLINFIAAVRSDFATPDMPFVLGRIIQSYGTAENNGLVRTAQVTVPTLVSNTDWVDTDDLQLTADPTLPGHFGTQGQIDLGIRFAGKLTQKPESPPSLPLPLDGPGSHSTAQELQATETGAKDGLFNTLDYGAKGDGIRLDTDAIQNAIDACTARGGGTVMIPPGKYRSAGLVIKSNVTLCLSAGATIVATGDPKDYQKHQAVLYAHGAQNVALTGSGTIDGSGGGVRTDDRYRVLQFNHCRDVSISEVTLRASPAWCAHLSQCDNVKIDGVHVDNCVNFNNDGLDIYSCQNVRISNCRLRCEDDAITLKTSPGVPCKNIVITNCILTSRWAGIRLGSESRGDFQSILVSNCVIHDTFGCGIKLQMVEGAEMRDLVFSNIVMTNVTGPISVRLGNWVTGTIPQPANAERPLGTLKNVLFSNIRARVAERPCPDLHQTDNYPPHEIAPGELRSCISITGQPDRPVEDITFNDVHITFPGGGTEEEAARKEIPDLRDTYPEYYMFGVLPAYGLYAHHVKGLTLNNVRFELASPDRRPATVFDDVQNLRESDIAADDGQKSSGH